MAGDLFRWLDAIWTKSKIEGTPPMYVINRFLASDRDYAEAARVLMRELREPDLVFHTWQGLVSRDRGAPRLQYPAPKRPPAADALVVRVMATRGVNREVAEREIDIIAMAGMLLELYREHAIEPPDDVVEQRLDLVRKRLLGDGDGV